MKFFIIALGILSTISVSSQTYTNDFSDPAQQLATIGRGECRVENGVLVARDAYARFGKPEYADYTITFRARAPKEAEQVQIWAAFRESDRFNRYVLGIKGGLQDDLYLFRSGYMGNDQLMGVRPLGFHPECGEWIDVRVEACGPRIRIFVNNSDKPYIDVTNHEGALTAPAGYVSLGGGWIDTEYDDLTITPLAHTALDNVSDEEHHVGISATDKEAKRKVERSAYTPKSLQCCDLPRTELELGGSWLFMPVNKGEKVVDLSSPEIPDDDWHIMNVPDFWTPIRIWLHGETMPSPRGAQPKGVSDTYYQRETDRCENYTFDYHEAKGAWYRQWLDIPCDIAGKKAELHFDAVSKSAEVYVNGNYAGSHLGMFGEFDVDATPYLHTGKNLVALYVARDLDGSQSQNSDAMENYYSSVRKEVEDNRDDQQANKEFITDIPHGFFGDNPAGIWQPVKLVVTDLLKIEDIFIKPYLTGADFDIIVANNSPESRKFDVVGTVTEKSTGEVLCSGTLIHGAIASSNSVTTYKASFTGLSPKLWEPSTPNLYDFRFTIREDNNTIDDISITSGFRTFESRDGYLYLNGRPYWLRGGNHIPFTLGMNNRMLADKFMQLMRKGNINATRTHTTPWNELWIDAADRNGIAVSFEGTWSWLMIHSTPIPSKATLDLWKSEWLNVMKKYRNHPSVVFWTVNNEMKFYDLDSDKDRAMEKFTIISDVVKDMRIIDPTRPVSFDSNYMRRNGVNRFGEEFISTVDDGDIDDNHGYYNWYDFSLFRFFKGEFQKQFHTPGRPLISQEMSTGYPNAETGHPTRSYQLIHQNPYSLVGYAAYDYADPAKFLKVQSFITGELAEALRRTGGLCSGIMHFSYMTWFRQCYDENCIAPWPAYYAMKRAMQPVLVSAELWGRHFYAGDSIVSKIYVVNDDEKGRDLFGLTLKSELIDNFGRVINTSVTSFPDVTYYDRKYITTAIKIPVNVADAKEDMKLRFTLSGESSVISTNEYEICVAQRSWAANVDTQTRKIHILSGDTISAILDFFNIKHNALKDATMISHLSPDKNLVILSTDTLADTVLKPLRDWQAKGGRLLLLDCPQLAKTLYPEYISGSAVPTEGDIVVMERNDHPVFDGLDELDLRYFNDRRCEIPTVCSSRLIAVRHPLVTELASQMKIHAYIDEGSPADRTERIKKMRGLTMLEISSGEGRALVSTMLTSKAMTDPVAGRLLTNMITTLSK